MLDLVDFTLLHVQGVHEVTYAYCVLGSMTCDVVQIVMTLVVYIYGLHPFLLSVQPCVVQRKTHLHGPRLPYVPTPRQLPIFNPAPEIQYMDCATITT